MKAFYTALLEKLHSENFKQHLIDNAIAPLRLTDLYRQQEHFEGNFDLFANAVLVEWEIDYIETPAIATITLHCCYEQLRDTSNLSQNREHALRFFDFCGLIDEAVRDIETETTGKPVLVSEGQDKTDSIVDIYMLTYQCSYTGRKKPSETLDGDFETVATNKNLIQKSAVLKLSEDNPYQI